jgi:hypothetical protein
MQWWKKRQGYKREKKALFHLEGTVNTASAFSSTGSHVSLIEATNPRQPA